MTGSVMHQTPPIPLIVRRTIPFPRQKLFELFSRADLLSQWFTPNTNIRLEILAFRFESGGRYRFRYWMPDGRTPTVGGHYHEIIEPERISVSWVWEAPDPLADIPMEVTFEFFEAGSTTEIVVTHEKLPSNSACSIYEDGWERALDGLQRFVAKTERQIAQPAEQSPVRSNRKPSS